MNYLPTSILPNMRFATESDFRSTNATFKIDIEYREWMLDTNSWELRVGDLETDVDSLKLKINKNLILVHFTPVVWNQKILQND